MNGTESPGDWLGTAGPELRALVERFPRLFRGELAPPGREVPAGCVELLGKLCQDIDTRLSEEQTLQFRLLQFKEGEGALRAYWGISAPDPTNRDVGLDTLQALTECAEAVSDSTCYFVGAAGQMRYLGGWFKLEASGLSGPEASVTAEVAP